MTGQPDETRSDEDQTEAPMIDDWTCPHNPWGCDVCFPNGGRP